MLLIFVAGAYALLLWAHARETDRRKTVLACTHEAITVKAMPPEFGGTLFTECRCGHQAHLTGLRPLPGGSFHLDDPTAPEADRTEAYVTARIHARRGIAP